MASYDGTLKFDTEIDSSGFSDGTNQLGKLASSGSKVAIAAIAAATAAIVAFGKSAIDSGKEFESSMSQLAATMGTTTDNITELEDKAKEMGSTTAFTAKEAADGLNILAMAGYDAKEQIEMIEPVLNLASAGATSLDNAASYLTTTLKGYCVASEDVGDMTYYYSDLMAKGATLVNTSVDELGEALSTVSATSNAYGQSVETTTVALLAMADGGITGSQAANYLNRMMSNLYAPTTAAKDALDELGVSCYDQGGNARDLMDIIGDLQDATAGLSEEESNAYMNTILGTVGLKGYNVIANKSSEEIEALTDNLLDCDGAAEQMADTQLDNLQGDITLLNSATDGLKLSLYDTLEGPLRGITQFITNSVIPAIQAVIDHLPLIISILAGVTAGIIAYTVAANAKAIADKAQAIAAGIAEVAQKALNAAMDANPIMAVVVAIGALTTALVAFALILRDTDSEAAQLKQELKDLEDEIEETEETLEEARAEDDATIQSYRSMADELEELTSRENLTRAEQERLNKICSEFSDAGLDIAYDETTNSVNQSTEAINEFCDALEGETRYNTAVNEYNTLLDERAELEAICADAEIIMSGETDATARQIKKAEKTWKNAQADIASLDTQIDAAAETIEEYAVNTIDADSEAAQLRDELADLEDVIDETTESFESSMAANKETADSYRSMASEIEELANRTDLTRAEQERLNTLCEQFADSGLDLAYDSATNSINMSTDAIYDYCDAMETELSYDTAMEEYNALVDQRAELLAIATDAEIIMSGETEATAEEMEAAAETYAEAQEQLEALNGQIDEASDLVEELGDQMDAQQQDTVDWEAEVTADVQSVCDAIIDLDQQYADAYDSAKESLEGQFGLWEEVGAVAITSTEEIMSALQSQEEYWTQYADNIDNLNNRQIDGLDDLVAAYSDGSTESAGYIATMAQMTDEELEAMIAEMGKVDEQQDRIATSAAEMATDYENTVTELCNAVVDKYADLDAADQLQEYGMNTMAGYVQGLEDGEEEVEGEMLSVSERGQEIFARANGINSPSTVYEEFGEYTVQGYINGLDGFDKAVQKELDKVSKTVTQWGASIELTAEETGAGTLSEMVDYFTQVPQEIQKQLTTALNNVNSWSLSTLNKFDDTGADTVKTVTKYFSQLPGKIKTQLDSALNNIASWANSAEQKIDDVGAEIVRSITSSFTSMTTSVKTQLDGITSYVNSWGNSLVNTFTSMGKNVMQGLINGMNSMTSSLYSSIKNSLGGMVTQAKKELDISSPSTVMANEIGRWIPPGIGEGFDAAMPALIADVNDGMDGLVEQMQAAVDASTVGFTAGSAATANYEAYRDGAAAAYSEGGQSVDISGTIYTTVELDGEKVGEAQTPIVDRNFARIDTQKRRGG